MKPHTPYTQSFGNKPKTTQTSGSTATTNSYGYGGGSSAYAPATSPAVTGGYGTSSAYAPAPAVAGGGYGGSSSVYTPAPAKSTGDKYGAYGPAPVTSTAVGGGTNVYSSSYAPAPVGGGYASSAATSGGGYSTSPKPSAPFAPQSNDVYGASKPSFSQALDVPPPIQQAPTVTINTARVPQQTAYGTSMRKPGSSSPTPTPHAVATPVGGFEAAPHNSVYSGGPTGGLISEGNPTKCHKVDYEIKGHEMQLVEIELDPEETVIAEAGAMMFLDEGIDFKSKLGDGSEPKQGFFSKLMSAGGRLLTGESLFMTHFTNKGHAKARVAFAAPFPGNIIPLNMANYGNKVICQKDAFLCAAKGTKVSIHFNKRIGSGLFGGEGFILQKMEGDGMAFMHAGGTIIRRELRGEKLRLDTGCLVGFTDGIKYDIQFVPGLKSMIFGGEGLFLATLQGNGTVWMQSLPFSRMADRIIQHAPSAGGRRQGEGSALTGGFGDVINGDGFGFNL